MRCNAAMGPLSDGYGKPRTSKNGSALKFMGDRHDRHDEPECTQMEARAKRSRFVRSARSDSKNNRDALRGSQPKAANRTKWC